MLKAIASCLLVGTVALVVADTASAQSQGVVVDKPPQTVNFTLGGFWPKGLEGRDDHDLLRENCFIAEAPDCTPLDFEFDDFTGLTFGAEWLFPIGNYVEMGAGVSLYSKSVESRFLDYGQDDPLTIPIEDDDIAQDLKLKTIPIAFTARVLPFGHSNPLQPYVGGGIALISWKYSEDGEFIRDFDCEGIPSPCVFRDEFSDGGFQVAPLFLAGMRFASDSFTVGGEFRYQYGVADIDPEEFFFRLEDTKMDLGGWTVQATFGVRFD